MRQYDVCSNPDRTKNKRLPYFLILQSDILGPFETVIVAPVYPERTGKTIIKLNPLIRIGNKEYRFGVQGMAAIPRSRVGRPIANASAQHAEFIAAIDLLFSGF